VPVLGPTICCRYMPRAAGHQVNLGMAGAPGPAAGVAAAREGRVKTVPGSTAW